MEEANTFEKLLDERFGRVHDKLDGIIVQTTKTNGRVTVLEGYSPMLDDICEEREKVKDKKSELVWEIIRMFLTGLVSVGGLAIYITYFKP